MFKRQEEAIPDPKQPLLFSQPMPNLETLVSERKQGVRLNKETKLHSALAARTTVKTSLAKMLQPRPQPCIQRHFPVYLLSSLTHVSFDKNFSTPCSTWEVSKRGFHSLTLGMSPQPQQQQKRMPHV